MPNRKKVAIIMGSDSDWPVVKSACGVLKDFDVPFEAHILSAHRTPEAAAAFAKSARANGYGVILCAAGMAAHLAGAFAANTTLPVVGIPMKGLCKLLLLFPIFTLFQSFSFLGWINKALLIFVIVILLFLITRKIEKRWVGILFAVFVVHVYALMHTTFPLYNSNMLFYYGFWILLVVYYTSCSKRAMETFKKSERFTRGVVQIWSIIVGISIFMPSSYVINKAWGSGRYFVSITGDAFRLAPTCLMIVTLVLGLYCLTRKKKYLLYITIPMYGGSGWPRQRNRQRRRWNTEHLTGRRSR